MMKVDIWKDERWPDYGISVVGSEYEISEELYARYVKVNADYDAVQDELRAIRDGGKQ